MLILVTTTASSAQSDLVSVLNLEEVADDLSRRLQRLFLKDENGQRPAVKQACAVDDNPLFH